MAYENLHLVIAGVSGEIYLTRLNKNNSMSESRKIATKECLRATTEWFMKNNKYMISYETQVENQNPTLFFTDDSEKAKLILKILES